MRAFVVCAVVMMVGCKSKKATLESDYCEGGVVRGQAQGDCLHFYTGNPDGNPDTISAAYWTRGKLEDRYAVRRAGPSKYELYLNGVLAGGFEQSGDWITLRFVGSTQNIGLRSDAPGAFL